MFRTTHQTARFVYCPLRQVEDLRHDVLFLLDFLLQEGNGVDQLLGDEAGKPGT